MGPRRAAGRAPTWHAACRSAVRPRCAALAHRAGRRCHAGDGSESLLAGTRIDHGQLAAGKGRELVGELPRRAVVVDAVGKPHDDCILDSGERRGDSLRGRARSGAKGCGCRAAAVERAVAGASTLRFSALAALAVGTISSGRLCPSASAIRRSIRKVRAPHCAAPAQPLSTTSTTGPEPESAFSLLGLSTGSASARITRAAAAMRISVSHHGVCAGVFSRFSMPMRMRVGGNSRRRGRGGMVRSSHQITGNANRPASSQGLRKAIGPSVMRRLPPTASGASSDSRRPCPAAA